MDVPEDDELINELIDTSEELCKEVLRVETLTESPLVNAGIYYALAYLYEHREEANHHDLKEMLYHLLGGLRKEVF
ncbi:head-tail connector protein [Streptococcus canis]|uniref:head-tail connector protein n=1 Tax=Streptococcus canis TaxID=1329 RepID=UPI00294ACA1D|nr:head-tail connector protein [Streptococcus canis]